MQHYWSLQDANLRGSWLTIGAFDGVHRGHQQILQNLNRGARQAGAAVVVLTFYPHPAVVLRGLREPYYLTAPEEKARLLGELGVDVVITHPFDQDVAALSAEDFMLRLHARLGISHLMVGHDFALGRGREGTPERLRQIGEKLGFTVDVVPPITNGGQVISSSQIRLALAEGEVQRAASLLGRMYRVPGLVIPGDGRGHSIGVPTANLEVWGERLLPKVGVYACRAQAAGKTYRAVTNIGVHPTFGNQPAAPRIETHLLDFEGNLYGQEISLEFIARLRQEQRFPSAQALVEQIHMDIAQARQLPI